MCIPPDWLFHRDLLRRYQAEALVFAEYHRRVELQRQAQEICANVVDLLCFGVFDESPFLSRTAESFDQQDWIE